MKKTAYLLGIIAVFTSHAQITELKSWLESPKDLRPELSEQNFSTLAITPSQVQEAKALLLEDHQADLDEQYGEQWKNRELEIYGFKMPFYYNTFGEAPVEGRSLFISMHGGGQGPASVNDQQYENQKHLYDKTLEGLEGVYLSVRAPENTWDLWHKNYIDKFFETLIQLAVLNEGVNPNRVYVMGYSAGGDGTYQIAPRMADRWAGAAMSAGHPGDAYAPNLRNVPFALHCGSEDIAYDRAALAATWGTRLDSLQTEDPNGYKHQVQVHQGFPHWMKLEDAVALPWIHQYTRDTHPERVVWKQDNRLHYQSYWLGTNANTTKKGQIAIVELDKVSNTVLIKKNTFPKLRLFLDNELLDLSKPIIVKSGDRVLKTLHINTNLATLYQTFSEKKDTNLSYPATLTIHSNNQVTTPNEKIEMPADWKFNGEKLTMDSPIDSKNIQLLNSKGQSLVIQWQDKGRSLLVPEKGLFFLRLQTKQGFTTFSLIGI